MARAAWLVQQQELAQEEAECEAAWDACGADHAAAADGSAAQPDAGEANLRAALEAADGCLGDALAAAAAAASLLNPGRPALSPPSATPAVVQQQLRAAQTQLGQAVAAVDAALQQQRLGIASPAGSWRSECGADDTSLVAQVQRLLNRHPLAALPCKAQVLHQAAQEEARHAQQQQRCRAALHAFYADAAGAAGHPQRAHEHGPLPTDADSCPSELLLDGSTDGITGTTADGWSASEHSVFQHARRACLAPGGGGETALVRRLAAALPSWSGRAVLAHERWHKESARLQAALWQMEAGWQQEKAALLGAAAGLLRNAEANALARAAAALEQLEAAAACLQSAYGLQAAQAAQEGRHGAEGLVAAAAVAEAAAKRFERWQVQEDYNHGLKQLLAQHKQRQAEAVGAAAEAEQKAAALRRREAAAAAAARKQQVAHRASRTVAKRAAREEAAAERQAAQARREAALEALLLQMAPQVCRDAVRATGPTESSAAAVSTGKAQHGLFAGALSGLAGEQLVLEDQRFKVGARAGV